MLTRRKDSRCPRTGGCQCSRKDCGAWRPVWDNGSVPGVTPNSAGASMRTAHLSGAMVRTVRPRGMKHDMKPSRSRVGESWPELLFSDCLVSVLGHASLGSLFRRRSCSTLIPWCIHKASSSSSSCSATACVDTQFSSIAWLEVAPPVPAEFRTPRRLTTRHNMRP
jgi:hypothetical protein